MIWISCSALKEGTFDEDIIKTIEFIDCQYLIKGKRYPKLASQVTTPNISIMNGKQGSETLWLVTKLNNLDKKRRFVITRVLQSEKDRSQ